MHFENGRKLIDMRKKIVLAFLEPFSISFRKKVTVKKSFFLLNYSNLVRQKYGLVFDLPESHSGQWTIKTYMIASKRSI